MAGGPRRKGRIAGARCPSGSFGHAHPPHGERVVRVQPDRSPADRGGSGGSRPGVNPSLCVLGAGLRGRRPSLDRSAVFWGCGTDHLLAFGSPYMDLTPAASWILLASTAHVAFVLIRGVLDGAHDFPYVNLVPVLGLAAMGLCLSAFGSSTIAQLGTALRCRSVGHGALFGDPLGLDDTCADLGGCDARRCSGSRLGVWTGGGFRLGRGWFGVGCRGGLPGADHVPSGPCRIGVPILLASPIGMGPSHLGSCLELLTWVLRSLLRRGRVVLCSAQDSRMTLTCIFTPLPFGTRAGCSRKPGRCARLLLPSYTPGGHSR